MTCTRLPVILVWCGLSAVTPPTPVVAAQTSSREASIEVTVASTQARITGVVVTMHQPPRPVPKARVRLRSTLGKILDMTRANDKGEFAFTVDRSGSYYVELVDDRGRVLAVEDVGETAVSVTLGQISTTIVRVPVALADGVLSTAAKTILGAAAAAGVAGVAATGDPISPEQ